MKSWILAAALAATGDNWAEFRGPGGQGHSDAVGLPREWSETQNVVWKTPVKGQGWSSPVVWGKQVWVTTSTGNGKEFFALCVDRETGKVVFDVKLFEVAKPEELWQKYNSYASPTPVIEEDRIYVHFGCYGTACLDTSSGKVVWTRTDLPCNHFRGAGSSPIVYQNLLIMTFDGFDVQYVIAVDKKTGKTVWKSDRSHNFGTDDGDRKKGYSTPIIIEVAGKPQLISTASAAAVALDPATGKEIWQVRYAGHSPAARPLYGHGMVYVTSGAGRELVAVRPEGKGDITTSHVAWKSTKAAGHKPSPLLVDDLIYALSDGASVVTCVDAKTGAEVWKQRIGGNHSASPLYADGAIWFFAEEGVTVAIAPGREFKEVGRGKLDNNGRVMGTPAVSGKSFFYRGESHLYRIEKK